MIERGRAGGTDQPNGKDVADQIAERSQPPTRPSVPQIESTGWSLTDGGLVCHEPVLDLAALHAMRQRRIEAFPDAPARPCAPKSRCDG